MHQSESWFIPLQDHWTLSLEVDHTYVQAIVSQ